MYGGIFCALILILTGVNGANILAVITTGYYSHQATWWPLWRTLANKGHHVYLMSPDPMEPHNNITQIDTSVTYQWLTREDSKKILLGKMGLIESFQKTIGSVYFDKTYDLYFNNTELDKYVNNGIKFDLLVVEHVPGFAALSYKYNCPYIGALVFDGLPWNHYLMGNPNHPAIFPFFHVHYIDKLTLLQRALSTVSTAGLMGIYNVLTYHFNGKLKNYLGDDAPSLKDIDKNASLLFINANPFLGPTRPLTPTTINLGGGLHIAEAKSLPKDLQVFLDNANNGCIYVNFGSIVTSDDLDEKLINHMLSVFKDLKPVKVLWKFENGSSFEKPDNVKFGKWMPQQDILRHNNVKVFISHGGLQSMEEAIYYGVPVLGIPFFSDQFQNINQIKRHKMGLRVDLEDIITDKFKESLKEILFNTNIRDNMKAKSKLSRDKPLQSLETAVWWIEYVIRNKEFDHLKSPLADIPLYQYFYLDVLVVLFIAVVFIIIVFKLIIKLVKLTFKVIFCKKNKTD